MFVIRDADEVQAEFVLGLQGIVHARRSQFIADSSAEFADVADDPEVGKLLDEARHTRPDPT
jgi:hypothetical protein